MQIWLECIDSYGTMGGENSTQLTTIQICAIIIIWFPCFAAMQCVFFKAGNAYSMVE